MDVHTVNNTYSYWMLWQHMARHSETPYPRHVHVFRWQPLCNGSSSSFCEPQPTYDEPDDAQFVDGKIAVFTFVLLHFLCQYVQISVRFKIVL